ncbi:MAG: porin [Chitinophagaceae bacterium]|nr:porin [Chitinophagaceae bacterium]
MKIGLLSNKLFLLFCCAFLTQVVRAQFLVDMIDTTDTGEKGLWAVFRKSDHLQISGYFQPQFQVAQSKGAENYSGGDFSAHSDNRFMIRRGRIRFDYAHFNEAGLPQAQVVFQFEGSEKGVAIRDFWGRYYENKLQLFSFTGGMFARPFGYEVNLGSGDRESPERGRMSQVLMRVERDLGAMITFEPRKKSNPLRLFKVDMGIFNGQGLIAPEEYDNYKDFIGRVSLKPYSLSKTVSFSAGASFFQGGLMQNSKYLYQFEKGPKSFRVDSSALNIGSRAPRRYRGFDAQLKIKNPWGQTELRGEYWWGKQTSYAAESGTPGSLLNEPYYVRDFNGAFFYLLQNIASPKHMIALKYDIYDPNRKISGSEIGILQSNTHAADIRYNTFGAGYIFFADEHLKLVFWYDVIKNEKTSLDGFTTDVKDNIFTFRVQFKF